MTRADMCTDGTNHVVPRAAAVFKLCHASPSDSLRNRDRRSWRLSLMPYGPMVLIPHALIAGRATLIQKVNLVWHQSSGGLNEAAILFASESLVVVCTSTHEPKALKIWESDVAQSNLKFDVRGICESRQHDAFGIWIDSFEPPCVCLNRCTFYMHFRN